MKMKEEGCLEEERGKVERMLGERLEAHDESRRAAQDKLHEFCEGLRKQVAEFKSRVNKELEEKFTEEDKRLQALLSGLRTADRSNAPKMLQRANAELLVAQSYEIASYCLGDDSESARKRARVEGEDGEKSAFDSGLCMV